MAAQSYYASTPGDTLPYPHHSAFPVASPTGTLPPSYDELNAQHGPQSSYQQQSGRPTAPVQHQSYHQEKPSQASPLQQQPNGAPPQQYYQSPNLRPQSHAPPPPQPGLYPTVAGQSWQPQQQQGYPPYAPQQPQQPLQPYLPLHRPQSHSQPPPNAIPPYLNGHGRTYSTPSSSARPSSVSHYRRPSDSRDCSRERDYDRDVDRDLDRSRHHRHSSRPRSGHKKHGNGVNTFLGAGGGALIGDVIFPGLGTVGGALLGGYGGHKVGEKKRSNSDTYSREAREGERRRAKEREAYHDNGDDYRRGRR